MHAREPPRFSHGTLKLMAGSFERIIRCSEWAIMRIRLICRRQAICLSDRYKHPQQTNQHLTIKSMIQYKTKPPGCTQEYTDNDRKHFPQNVRKMRFFQLGRWKHYRYVTGQDYIN